MARKKPAPFEPNLRQPAPALGARAQRTIEKILDATRQSFLTNGYAGTSIDDITTRAGVSRASFYTYFPTKRDALLALGSGATSAARTAIDGLDELPAKWTVEDLEKWLHESFGFFDAYGSFGMAWGQAAYEDPEIHAAGMKTHLHTCALFGEKLNELRGSKLADDEGLGLLVFSMLERTWVQQKLYEPRVTVDDVVVSAARLIQELVRS